MTQPTLALLLSGTLPDWVRQMLRAEAATLAFGVVLTAAGLCCAIVYLLPRKDRDVGLISFALFVFLYGAWLLAETRTVGIITDAPANVLSHIAFGLAYLIPLPFLVFFLHTIGQGWHRLALWVFRLQIGLASLAILADIGHADPGKMATANHILVALGLLVFLFLLFAPRQPSTPDLRLFRLGFLLFAGFRIATSLFSTGLLSGPSRLELIGLLGFVVCLATIAARRVTRNQEHLGAIREELEIARRIQLGILPVQLPQMSGLEIATRHLASSSVAGDFYDFLPDAQGRLGILIADVSGHGVPAALLSSMLKVAIATQEPNAADPAKVLSGLNHILFGKMHEQFVTATYLWLDVMERRAVYSSAGHPPLLVWRPREQRVAEYEETGLVLGISQDVSYSNTSFPFEPGDRILLYTDGILEAANGKDEEFEKRRFKQFIQAEFQLHPDRFCDSLLVELQAWVASPAFADDVTLIVVDSTEPNDPLLSHSAAP